jgi:hypothetical protein
MIYFAIMIQYSAGDISRYLTAITGIKTQGGKEYGGYR